MDTYEKRAAVEETVEMMRAAIGRPRWKAMIRRRVKEAVKRALWDRALKIYEAIENLDEQDD